MTGAHSGASKKDMKPCSCGDPNIRAESRRIDGRAQDQRFVRIGYHRVVMENTAAGVGRVRRAFDMLGIKLSVVAVLVGWGLPIPALPIALAIVALALVRRPAFQDAALAFAFLMGLAAGLHLVLVFPLSGEAM